MYPVPFTSEHERAQAQIAQALVDGLSRADVAGVRSLFAGPADIDDPAAGRQVDGGFERLVENWAPAHQARIISISPIASTSGANGRFAGSEFHLELEQNGKPKELDIVVVSEFAGDKLVRNRLYYRLARLTGQQHQRTRILPEEPLHIDPWLPGMEEYEDTLRAGEALAMAATFTDDAVFDGHGESTDLRDGLGMGRYVGRDAIIGVLTQMFEIGDEEAGHDGDGHNGTILEMLNVFNNGTTTIVEFNIIHKNHPVNRVSAGVAAYQLDGSGKLQEARIYDEAW